MRALEEKAAMRRHMADNLSGDETIAGRLRDPENCRVVILAYFLMIQAGG